MLPHDAQNKWIYYFSVYKIADFLNNTQISAYVLFLRKYLSRIPAFISMSETLWLHARRVRFKPVLCKQDMLLWKPTNILGLIL
jgi:hypothetical protein